MKLKQLCQTTGLYCPAEDGEYEILSVVTDSRRAGPNSIFVCIQGLHSNGHTFIDQAYQRGCRCFVIQEDASVRPAEGAVYLRAPDTRRSAAELLHAICGCPGKRFKLIGVTGTNGKTSVTHFLREILETAGHSCGLIGTVGCYSQGNVLEGNSFNPLANMTTPDPEVLYPMLAQMASDGVEYVLMEVTSHALALQKVAPLQFAVGVFTNLTPDHLDFHKTMEEYAATKARLFASSALSVLNIDSPYVGRIAAACTGEMRSCSQKGNADYCAKEIDLSSVRGVAYTLVHPCGEIAVRVPVTGEFTVMNSLQAAAVAMELGIDPAVVQRALSQSNGVRGRMERVDLGADADFTVLIDYAHTPDALERLLRSAKPLCKDNGKIRLLFGCGGDRDKTKRAVMGAIASQYADRIYVTSDNSRGEDPQQIIKEIVSGISPDHPYRVIEDRAEAIRQMLLDARTDDVLLLAGKGHEEYEIRQTGRHRFSEREMIQSAFAARRNRE